MFNYRITIESLAPIPSMGLSTNFDVQNHDNLFTIIESVRSKGILDRDNSAALAIGLKLFSEIVIANRHDPLFAPMLEPVRTLIQQLKSSYGTDAGRQVDNIANTRD